MDGQKSKQILEALIFTSGRPLTITEVREVLDGISEEDIRAKVSELNEEYISSGRSFHIREVAGGFRMETMPDCAAWLKLLYRARVRQKLTKPSLETLAIIAYRQPVSKPEIEAIRGVNVDGVIQTLLEKNLIKIAGRREGIGRPIVYATTSEFLEHFGLSSLGEMPKLSEVEELKDAAPELAALEEAKMELEEKEKK